MSDLAFPEITPPPVLPVERVPVPAGIELAKIDLTAVALAQYGDWRKSVAETKASLSTLVLDLSTPTKIKEARSLRARLIDRPLADVRKVAAGIKSKMAQTSKALGAELEQIEAAYAEADALILPQIEKREAELEREKAEREEAERRAREAAAAAEAERKAKHQQTIATLAGYVLKAAGKPAEQIARGIAYLEGLAIPDGSLEEFTAEAQRVKGETLAALKAMHAKAVDAEATAAEMARLRAELDARRAAEAEEQRRLQEAMEAATVANPPFDPAPAEAAMQDFERQAEQQRANQIVHAIPEPVALGTIPAPAVEPVKLDLPPAHPGPVVMIDRAAPPAEAKPTLKLGDINARIAPLKIDADGLAALGFPFAAKERAACLYFASDLPKILAAMRQHLEGVA